ncbi:casein kinase II [Pelomyxa schiedti]|nr:casein kinase II [Pelomyxa schiedti]
MGGGQVVTVAREHMDACRECGGAEYMSTAAVAASWGNYDDYEIGKKIGRGTYSDVFIGFHTKTGKKIVIKVLKPTIKGIKKEVKILVNLRNGPNIIQLFELVKVSNGIECFILECVDNTNFKVLYPQLNEFEVRYYMYQLLRALGYAHSRGIMHRDLKPHNVMIDRHRRILRLIDWGLAEFYEPGRKYSTSVGSRYYRGPELFSEYCYYDYSVDMWALGCILAEMVFKFEAFFCGINGKQQLLKIVQVLGTNDYNAYLAKYGIILSRSKTALLSTEHYPKRPWENWITAQNGKFCTPEALAVLDSVLIYDHHERYTANEVLQMHYFDPVRRYLNGRENDELPPDTPIPSDSL